MPGLLESVDETVADVQANGQTRTLFELLASIVNENLVVCREMLLSRAHNHIIIVIVIASSVSGTVRWTGF